jgi:hypothetical protein
VTSPVRLPITCPKYEAVPGTKRCRHYHANGACGLPDEFMCVEWLKVNGHAAPVSVTRPATTEAPRRDEIPVVRTVSDADLASFKALGTEVRLATEGLGDVWLVPAYTGADRQELSVDHAALIAAVASAFPGARVTALVRKPKPPVPS